MTNEELRKAIEEGRAVSVPLEEVFANPIGDIVTEVFDACNEERGVYEDLSALGEDIGTLLLGWNATLPEGERHQTGWVLKKAHDEVNARLRRTILARLNVKMGFDPDYQP